MRALDRHAHDLDTTTPSDADQHVLPGSTPRVVSPVTAGSRSRRSRLVIVHDIWGDRWRLTDRRPTDHGFAILFGRVYPTPRGLGGGGGARVIVTARLAAYLRAHARRPFMLQLPMARNALRRVLRLLGLDHLAWADTRIAWWMDRIDDLATLSSPRFVAKHRATAWTRSGTLSVGLVRLMRIELLGDPSRSPGWWKAPAVRTLLTSRLPRRVIAARLQISPSTVNGLQRRLREGRGQTAIEAAGSRWGSPARRPPL